MKKMCQKTTYLLSTMSYLYLYLKIYYLCAIHMYSIVSETTKVKEVWYFCFSNTHVKSSKYITIATFILFLLLFWCQLEVYDGFHTKVESKNFNRNTYLAIA